MFDIIVACTKNFGIGYENNLPWNCPEEMYIFRKKTLNSVLIVGRKTFESLPKLKNRIIICVSKNGNIKKVNNDFILCDSLEDAINVCKQYTDKKIFIAGGKQIYETVINYYIDYVDKLHISFMKEDYKCDTFVNLDFYKWVIEEQTFHDNFTHIVMSYVSNGEEQYLKILEDILDKGETRNTRNGVVKSLFCKNISFDLRKGFPLLTTKKMFFKGIVEELLFFIRGDTDTKILEEKGIQIWKGNTSREFLDSNGKNNMEEGLMGPMYGYQWRYFNAKYDEKTGKPDETGKDQLKYVIEEIKTNPNSRRIIMTSFNPLQADNGVLYPCHSLMIQFYVSESNLDMFCYNRSQDFFLGVPFNIASSALLLTIIAKKTNLIPRHLFITMGDVHLYKQHFEVAETQIIRTPYLFPILETDINSDTNINQLKTENFKLKNYIHHSAIKTEMIA